MATRTSSPAYMRIEQHLRERIAGLAPGDPLPSDAELCRRFNVSRMTARQAVAVLVSEGLLYRVTGSGTFVAAPPVHRRVSRLLSFTENMRRFGKVASARVLTAGSRVGTSQENAELEQSPRARVIALRRLRLADDLPIAIESVVLPGSCGFVLEEEAVTGSVHEALRDHGLEPVHSAGTLTAVAATAEQAELLRTSKGAPLIMQRARMTTREHSPVQISEVRYVGERFVFDFDQDKHEYTRPDEREREPIYDVHAFPDTDGGL